MGLKKLFTALRGLGNEAVEAVEDSQAIRILEQEMRDAQQELDQSNQALTTIVAKRKLVEGRVSSLKQEVDKYTGYAIKASEAGDEPLALECAEKVSDLEQQLVSEEQILNQYLDNERSLKENTRKASMAIRKMTQQVDQVKANAQVQKAHAAVTARTTGAGTKMNTALSSLERIKAKQAEQQMKIEAAEELAADESGDSLEARLKEANIVSGGAASGKSKLDEILAARNSKPE